MYIDSKASSLSFVYPFLYDADTFETCSQAAEDATWLSGDSGQSPLKVWIPEAFCEVDMLSYVANFLNPRRSDKVESASESPPDISTIDITRATARLWTMEGNTLQSFHGIGTKALWNLMTPKGSLAFVVKKISLALFQSGVGFITVYVAPTRNIQDAAGKPEAGKGVVEDWLNFVHFFRFMDGKRRVSIQAERTTGLDPQTKKPVVVPFVPLQGEASRQSAPPIAEAATGHFTFSHILDALLKTVAPGFAATNNTDQSWYKEVFVRGQMLPFVALFIRELAENNCAPMLYRIRNFFHMEQDIHPLISDLNFDNSYLLPYVNQQWFTFSLDGGAFVAFDPPDNEFFRVTLPDHLADQYYLLFLLSLQQRFTLMKIQDAVARGWVSTSSSSGILDEENVTDARLAVFKQVRNLLLAFTARSYFTQVMQQEHHHRVYRKWLETFQVERLYEEAHNSVDEMYNELQLHHNEQDKKHAEYQEQQNREQEQRSNSIERTLTALLWILGAPTLTLGFIVAAAEQSWDMATWVLIGSVVAGALIFALITWSRSQTKHTEKKRDR